MHARVATISQADVRGAETACTFIATMACAHHLASNGSAPTDMELCIHQGGALYTMWPGKREHPYAYNKEAIDMVRRALSIEAGIDYNGYLWKPSGFGPSLDDALLKTEMFDAAILTIGATSVALLRMPNLSYQLFDSHAQCSHGGKAVTLHFSEMEDMIAYLRKKFQHSTAFYSICHVRRRTPMEEEPCASYQTEQEAWAAADVLPHGGAFFNVWRHAADGRFLVAHQKPSRHYIPVVYPSRPVAFRAHAATGEADKWIAAIVHQLSLEQNTAVVASSFIVQGADIVHPHVWFRNLTELSVFLQRVSPSLRVLEYDPRPSIGYYSPICLTSIPLALRPLAVGLMVDGCKFLPSGIVKFTRQGKVMSVIDLKTTHHQIRLARAEEMQHDRSFPEGSQTARLILGFIRACLSLTATVTAAATVRLVDAEKYVILFQDAEQQQQFELTRTHLHHKSNGRTWPDNPSAHWDLSFLFF